MIPNGYNISPGGRNAKHSEEAKEKIGKSKLGIPRSEETKKKLSEKRKGKYTGKDNFNAKMVYCVELNKYFNTINDAASFCNVAYSAITRSCKNYRLTSGGYHWRFLGEEHIPIISRESEPKRRCICIDTGEIFESMTAASRKYGVHPSAIRSCCVGKSRTCCKMKWEYYDNI